jgi:hypothetical protein
MKYILLLLAMCIPGIAMATSVPPKPLDEMVRESDHVVVATITSVDMVDGSGKPLTDRSARTGPGSNNQMRFHLRVEAVLFTRSKALPSALTVPLWTMWHYALGNMQDQVTGSRGIFLLKGDAFEPTYPTGFQRALDERSQIEHVLAPRP